MIGRALLHVTYDGRYGLLERVRPCRRDTAARLWRGTDHHLRTSTVFWCNQENGNANGLLARAIFRCHSVLEMAHFPCLKRQMLNHCALGDAYIWRQFQVPGIIVGSICDTG